MGIGAPLYSCRGPTRCRLDLCATEPPDCPRAGLPMFTRLTCVRASPAALCALLGIELKTTQSQGRGYNHTRTHKDASKCVMAFACCVLARRRFLHVQQHEVRA